MAVALLQAAAQQYVGGSGDAKPMDGSVMQGSFFTEKDTGNIFQWDGRNWNLFGYTAASATQAVPAGARDDLAYQQYLETRAIRMAWEEWLEKDSGELLELASQPEED